MLRGMLLPLRDHNPSERTPWVTRALIAVNVVVFLAYLPLFGDARALMAFFLEWGVVPRSVSSGEGLGGLVTSQFLHGGWLHLGFNMLFLWIFGDNIEEELGHLRYLGFYLVCGVVAALAQVAAEPFSTVPMVGASGAIAGVLGGYLLMFPRARVDVLFFFIILIRIVPLPAWLLLGGWFALQVLGGLSSPPGSGGVAYWAHAGGFVAGLVLAVPLWLRRGGPAYWRRTLGAPPHPEAQYRLVRSRVPRAGRRRDAPPPSGAGPWGRRPGGREGPATRVPRETGSLFPKVPRKRP